MQSEMDVLVLEDCVLHKAEQPLGPRARGAEPERTSPPVRQSLGRPGDGRAAGRRHAPRARNPATGASYPVEEGIPRLFVPTDAEQPTART